MLRLTVTTANSGTVSVSDARTLDGYTTGVVTGTVESSAV